MADETVKKIWDKMNSIVTNKRLRKNVVPDTAFYILNQSHITANISRKISDKRTDNHLIKQDFRAYDVD